MMKPLNLKFGNFIADLVTWKLTCLQLMDDVAVVVEVKSRLTQNDVRQVLNTLTHSKTAFPHYAAYQIYGAAAAIELEWVMG